MNISKLFEPVPIPRFLWWLAVVVGVLTVFNLTIQVAFAADVPSEQPAFALPTEQLYAALIGALTPLVGYVINHRAPWVSDKVKGLVQIGLVTLTGALYAVLDGRVDLFSDQALQLVMTAFFAAFVAHTAAWKPTNVSTMLGAGRNTTAQVDALNARGRNEVG